MAVAGSPVHLERAGPTARITLDSPSNANALSAPVLSGLLGAAEACRLDDGVRVVVLGAAGRTFCSGADMAERLDPPPGPAVTIGEVLSALAGLPQVLVARVQGHVRGGGMGLVAVADMAVSSAAVSFAFSEARLGVAPAVVAVPVLRRMSRRAFERYALTGDVFGAPEAAAAGLVNEVVPGDAELDGWVDGITESVLACSPLALRATKGLPAIAAAPWDDAIASATELSDALFSSDDGREGMTAFFEKRRPRWAVRAG